MKIVRPTLVLNKTKCLQNIELMAQKAKRHNLQFRPHFKTHQSLQIGRWFREYGVNAITVSSLSMANYFIQDGWEDITIAMPFNRYEIDLLNRMATMAKLNIIVDTTETLLAIKDLLTEDVGIYVEITTGYQRSGIPSSSLPLIEDLVKEIVKVQHLNFKGFLSHSGHTYNALSKNEVQNIHFDAVLKMTRLKRHFSSRFPSIEISIGDTPSCSVSENFNGIDEIRPGNFVFYDLVQHSLGACNIDDIAVKMHCPVVSKQPQRNEIIIYGGAVHFSKDSLLHIDGKANFGRVIIQKDGQRQLLGQNSYLCRLSQEHGVIRVSSREFGLIDVGDIVEVIPVHSCLTSHAMGFYMTNKGEKITTISCIPSE